MQNGGMDSITPENKAKLDAMSSEEVNENRSNWASEQKFGNRVLVEAWNSGFKRTVGDEITARTPEAMEQELLLKVGIYNHMNDDALAKGYTGTRVVINEGWTGGRGSRGGQDGEKSRGAGGSKTSTGSTGRKQAGSRTSTAGVKARKGVG